MAHAFVLYRIWVLTSLMYKVTNISTCNNSSLTLSRTAISPVELMKLRAKKLLVPLLFALLVFVIPQVYIVKNRNTILIEGLLRFSVNTFWISSFSVEHLWFLPFLFIVTLANLPIMRWMIKQKNVNIIDHRSVFQNLALLGKSVYFMKYSIFLGLINLILFSFVPMFFLIHLDLLYISLIGVFYCKWYFNAYWAIVLNVINRLIFAYFYQQYLQTVSVVLNLKLKNFIR